MKELFIKNLWLWKCGLSEKNLNQKFNFDQLKKSEWSIEFEKKMRNRLIFGALRYGLLNAKNKNKYNRIESALKRLKKYKQNGNKEMLVDVANMMLLEFEEGSGVFFSDENIEHTNIII